MKKLVLAAALSLATPAFARADDQTDLMKRMGFSDKEIAATQERHQATAKALGATGPKNQESAANNSGMQAQAQAQAQAEGINDLRSIRQARYQAIQASKAAEKAAQDAAARAEEAENKARTARNYTTWAAGNPGISSTTFSQALIGRDQFEDAAYAARQEADEKEREATEIAEQSERIIAKANALEAKLRSKGIDE